jgi:hypothetical protein
LPLHVFCATRARSFCRFVSIVPYFGDHCMTQRELNRAVAEATGEDLREVRRRGFSIADPVDLDFDPEPNCIRPKAVDWDLLEAERLGLFPARRFNRLAALAEA